MLEGFLVDRASSGLPSERKGSTLTSAWALGVVLAGLLVVGISSAALGQDTILDSGTTTVSTATNFDGDLYVATTGTASLEVITGGYATNTTGYLGFNAGGVGTATVSSGTWANSGNLYVGGEGTGTLSVTGGSVTNSDGYIATSNNSVGTVTVSSGTWANSGMLVVGLGGTGTLNVTGGSVTNSRGYLGNSNNSVGTVTVSGGTWATSGELKIGNYYDDPEFPEEFAIATGTLTMTGGLVTVSGALSRATNNGTSLGTINLNAGGTLQIGTGGAGSRLDVGNLTNDGTLVFNQSNNYTYSDSISGSGAVTKAGAGTLTLSAANTYTGLTTIGSGTLAYGTNNALGTGGVAVNGGVLNLSTFSDSVGTVTLTSGTIAGTGTLTSSSGFSMDGTGLASASLAGAVGLTKTGNGTLTLSANNGYTGRTQVNGGVLAVNNTNALAGTGTISFGGGTLQYSASNTRDYSAKILNSGSAISIDTNGQSVTFATGLGSSNTGGLTKTGLGTLTLTASNGYTGGTTISSGTLQVGNGGTTGSINGNVVNNAMLTFNRSDALTYSGEINGSGGLRKTNFSILTLSGSNGYTGVTNIAGGALALNNTNALAGTGTISFAGGTLQYSASNTVDYSSKILGSYLNAISIDTNSQSVTFATGLGSSNTGGLTKSGLGTLTLSASNGYTGTTLVNGGVLALGNANALARTGTLSFGGGSLQYSASNTVDYSSKILSSGSAISIDTNGQNVTFATGLAASNTGGLTKLGNGTLTLSGSSSYTGATAVNGGRLLVNGQLGNTAVAVNASGLLSGSGTILGGVTVASSGTLSPGNSPGVLTVGSLSLSDGSHTLMEITGTSASLYDQIVGVGSASLTYGGNLDLVMSGSYADGTTFNLFRNFSTTTLDFAAVGLNATGEYAGLTFSDSDHVGGVWTSSWTTNHQRLVFSTTTGNLVVVPEPSTYAMAVAGLACGGWQMMRRRRLRKAATLAA